MERDGANRAESASGFSLIELMIAIGVLSLVLLFMIACFTNILNGSRKGGDMTVATYLGESLVNQLKVNPAYLSTALTGALAGSFNGQASAMGQVYSVGGLTQSEGSMQNAGGSKFLNNIVFNYTLTAKEYPINTNPVQNLYVVNVEISWWGDPSHERTGTGKLKTELIRAFYLHG